jgi:hypothetical protein
VVLTGIDDLVRRVRLRAERATKPCHGLHTPLKSPLSRN